MNTIHVIVDEPPVQPSGLAARNAVEDLVQQMRQKTLELDADVLASELESVYLILANSLTRLRSACEDVDINAIEFSLGVDSKGNLYTAEVLPGNPVQKFVFKDLVAAPPANALTAELLANATAPR